MADSLPAERGAPLPEGPGEAPAAGEGAPRPDAGGAVPPMLLRALPRILIVRTGSTAPEVRRRHGDYDRWFRDALADHDLAFDLCDATRSPFPDPVPYAGVLVTGSVKSILEPEPWMEALGGFLRGVDRMGVPLLGVCFGCQALAWARGGRVVRSPAGFEIGAVDVTLSAAARLDPLFSGLPSPLRVLSTHEDRVEAMPPGAVALAGNGDTPIQAFRIGERTWGVQFHPEATADILRALILLRSVRLEAEARGRGEAEGGRTAALLRDLERFDPRPARAVLENFARLCRRGREPGTMM